MFWIITMIFEFFWSIFNSAILYHILSWGLWCIPFRAHRWQCILSEEVHEWTRTSRRLIGRLGWLRKPFGPCFVSWWSGSPEGSREGFRVSSRAAWLGRRGRCWSCGGARWWSLGLLFASGVADAPWRWYEAWCFLCRTIEVQLTVEVNGQRAFAVAIRIH